MSKRRANWLVKYFLGLVTGLLVLCWIEIGEVDQPPTFFYYTSKDSISNEAAASDANKMLASEPPLLHDEEAVKPNVVDVSEVETTKGLLLIGVMTSETLFEERACAIARTWASPNHLDTNARVIFYMEDDHHSKAGGQPKPLECSTSAEVVRLRGVKNAYPPQKKSFMMLLHMHTHFADQFRWFMRADDDLYVNTGTLSHLLASIKSEKDDGTPVMHYVGRTGYGRPDEDIGMSGGENYCMGGPGVLINHHALKALAPVTRSCLRELETYHEDVEVGRCLSKHDIAKCTSAYELQSVFQNIDKKAIDGFEVGSKTATVHPLKSADEMHKMHLKMLTHQRRQVLHEMAKLSAKNRKEGCRETGEWSRHSKGKTYTFAPSLNNYKMATDTKLALTSLADWVTEDLNLFAWEKGRTITYRGFNYGYSGQSHGCDGVPWSVDYILDLQLTHHQFKWKKVDTKVRKHINLSRPFAGGLRQALFA